MDILFEDNHILVVLKPQNVPSQEDATKNKEINVVSDNDAALADDENVE